MDLVYLVNKPYVSRCIARWLLLFLEYQFIVVFKPDRTHIVVDALFKLLDIIKLIGIPNQITYATLFML